MVDPYIQEYNKKARTRHYLMNYILEKGLLDGARIPSENQLTQKLKFSRGTVRHAIGDLVSEGILERRSGSGTFFSSVSAESKHPLFQIGIFQSSC